MDIRESGVLRHVGKNQSCKKVLFVKRDKSDRFCLARPPCTNRRRAYYRGTMANAGVAAVRTSIQAQPVTN
jgi:hypothetical protein